MTEDGGMTTQLQGDHEGCRGSTTKFGGMWKIPSRCPFPYTTEFENIAALQAWQALAFHRAGRKDEAQKFLGDAVRLAGELKTDDMVFLSAIVAYFTNIRNAFRIFEIALRSKGEEKKATELEHLRIVLTYGGASTPAARAVRSARVLWAEHPHATPAVYSLAAILLCAAVYIPAQRRLNRMAAGLFFASGPLLTRAARSVPRRVNAWLHPARPAAHPPPIATPAAGPSPAPMPPPAPMPMYFHYRYPNQAYRIAGYCFAAFWIVLLGPLAVALLMPAFTLLSDFSTAGFQRAYNHFIGILATSVTWARLWFALLLFSLLGFMGFKLYGRFSLPKRMRPPIRVVYGALRFTVLGAILAAAGTFLAYFTAAFAGIYNNPIVRTLITALRKLLGF